jgi:hypothetical protein
VGQVANLPRNRLVGNLPHGVLKQLLSVTLSQRRER